MAKNIARILLIVPLFSPAFGEGMPQALEEVRKAGKELLTRNPATKSLTTQIQKELDEISQLENKAEITPLYEQLAKIKREACIKQQKDPAIKDIMAKIRALRKTMAEKTGAERSQIEDLTQALQETDDETEQKRIQAKIGVLEKNIKQKVSGESQKIKQLNRSIRTIMKSEVEKARPILAELQKKYKRIEKNIAEHDKRISDLVDEIENSLSEKGQLALEALRERSVNLQRKIARDNPCVPSSAKDRDWIAYFM